MPVKSILPTDFHVTDWKHTPVLIAGWVDFPSYPFIQVYPFIRDLRLVSFETINKGAITYLTIIAYLGMYYVVFCQNIDSEATI